MSSTELSAQTIHGGTPWNQLDRSATDFLQPLERLLLPLVAPDIVFLDIQTLHKSIGQIGAIFHGKSQSFFSYFFGRNSHFSKINRSSSSRKQTEPLGL